MKSRYPVVAHWSLIVEIFRDDERAVDLEACGIYPPRQGPMLGDDHRSKSEGDSDGTTGGRGEPLQSEEISSVELEIELVPVPGSKFEFELAPGINPAPALELELELEASDDSQIETPLELASFYDVETSVEAESRPISESVSSAAPSPPPNRGPGDEKKEIAPSPPNASAPRVGRGAGLAVALFVLAGVSWAVAGYARTRRGLPGSEGEIDAGSTDGSLSPYADRVRDETSAAATDAEEMVTEEARVGTDSELVEDENGPPLDTSQTTFDSTWRETIDSPIVVTYTVRHGGSIKNVANLFKIFHHEIRSLNGSYALEQNLSSKTKVVVWRAKDGHKSASIGFPAAGSLEGAVPMMEGPGRILKATPWKCWGTIETVSTLDAILREWEHRKPGGQPVLVGNMSAPMGGKLSPHRSHQSGRDVDLSYIQIENPKEELNWREMSKSNLDAGRTWDLLKLLVESRRVQAIFIDSKIQKLLYRDAVANRRIAKTRLSRWIEYPRQPGTTSAIIRHVPGHRDHIHVRFKCSDGDRGCKSR